MNNKKLESYKSQILLSKQQKEILVGLLLGDAHLETQNNGRTFRLKYSRSMNRHKEYFLHVYNLFKNCILQKPYLRVKAELDFEDKKSIVTKRAPQLVFSTLSLL